MFVLLLCVLHAVSSNHALEDNTTLTHTPTPSDSCSIGLLDSGTPSHVITNQAECEVDNTEVDPQLICYTMVS